MEKVKPSSNPNEFAVSQVLNERVTAIIAIVVMADSVDLLESMNVNELNRAYVLLINELEKLYDRCPELAAIKPEPIWRRFDVLRTATWDINEYSSELSID